MNNRKRYEAVIRRYERMSVIQAAASGIGRTDMAQICVGSVRLPVQIQNGKIVALGTHPLPRKALGELLTGLERACRLPSLSAGDSVS